MTNDEKIRSQILSVMAEQGLRQAPLARKLGITPQSLNQVIKGDRAALPKSLTAVLDELGLELVVKAKDDKDLVVPVRAASEKSEGGATPDYGEWLEAFLAAAKGQDMSANPYDQGSIVLVQFYRQHVRPCVIVTDAKSVRESDIYGIVPLAPSLSRPTGGLTPTFEKREGVLPTTSIALCSQLQMVEPARVISYVGQLDSRQLKLIQNGLAELFTLGPAPDARSVRK